MNPSDASELPKSLETLFQDHPEFIILENGLSVIFQQNPSHPLISVQAWIKTGSIHEGEHLGSGLSHFLEHMLFKGTERRGPGEIASAVQEFGGQINAYTAFDRTVYYIDGPAEALDETLDLLCDMTLHSTLPHPEVQKEKEVILREIDMTLDDPDRIVARAMFSTTFREHPFRYPVIGLRPLFEKVDRTILESYYRDRYQPNNMVLSIVGDFKRSSLLKAIEKTFGSVSRGTLKPVLVPGEPKQLAMRETRLSGDYQTARGLVAYKIPSMRHPDAPTLDILASIIGSGYSGRLRQKLREEMNLVHSIGASTWNPGNPGLFYVQYQCAPEKAAKVEEAIRSEMEQLAKTGFTEQEIEKARRFAMVSEVQSRQTTSGLASRLGLVTALVGDVHYPRRYFQKIHALGPDDLGELAEKTFIDDHLSLTSLLPTSTEAQVRPDCAPKKLEPFKEKVLPNGARILWQCDPRLPRTFMRFAGLGGPLYEDDGQQGATSLLTTVMARDTGERSAREVAIELESNGGFLTDSSGNNTFALAVEVIPEFAGQGFQALSDAVLKPAFKAATIKREREAQLAHIRMSDDEILDRGRNAMRREFFGTHPFASDPCGNLDSVANLDESSLKELYERLIVAKNAVLVLTGNFDAGTLLPMAEEFLAKLPDQPFEVRSLPFKEPARTGELSEIFPREQAVVFDAFPDVGFQPETEIIGEVLDELLSDMSGPLFRSVREDQSLAYYVGASRLLGYDYGSFYLYAGTHPSSTQAVFNCFDIELERIRSGNLTEKELADARTRLKVHNRFSLQSPATRAARAALNALYRKPIMDWKNYEQRLDALTLRHLTDFAGEHLVPEKRLRFTIGPKND
ncbi:insulinase family protein [Puniceicoccales bacterium CK1056]|uniref:Insulinase family protein n=1 Tax=Oceanipulchritudo coccoides TaxID=2706888 RepID=A0A6B2M0B6_9BACT|nr:pitrilysin family protein [Oceanipulchritudo coccoides]NDV61190.1 insulinase family protein [Oceanipulchritudo coccoides]